MVPPYQSDREQGCQRERSWRSFCDYDGSSTAHVARFFFRSLHLYCDLSTFLGKQKKQSLSRFRGSLVVYGGIVEHFVLFVLHKNNTTVGVKNMTSLSFSFSSSCSSSPISFASLTQQALKLFYVAEFLSPRDLLAYQSTCREMAQLYRQALIGVRNCRCRQRWEPWPRYRLTTAREQDLLLESSAWGGSSWKKRWYGTVERDTTRTTLYETDLHQLDWYLT